jgi:hypothetical protein
MYTSLISDCIVRVSLFIDVTFTYLKPAPLLKPQIEDTAHDYATVLNEQTERPISNCMIPTIKIFFNIIIEHF